MFIQTLNFNETNKFPKNLIINGKLEENPSFALSVCVTVGRCDSVTRLCLTFCSIKSLLEIIFTKYLVFS